MSKLVKCNACGKELAKSANRCPNCGASQHQAALTACVVIILVAIIAIVFIGIKYLGDADAGAGTTVPTQSSSPLSTTNDNETILVDNDYIKATYVEVFEADSVDGAFYFRLNVENKSETELWISLADASVNGVTALATSGVPMTIQPGKSSNSPFIFSYSDLGISELSQVSYIGFKINISNNTDMSSIATTDEITVTLNQ